MANEIIFGVAANSFLISDNEKEKTMVKSILGICSAALFIIICFSSLATRVVAGDDWKKSEHNWNILYEKNLLISIVIMNFRIVKCVIKPNLLTPHELCFLIWRYKMP